MRGGILTQGMKKHRAGRDVSFREEELLLFFGESRRRRKDEKKPPDLHRAVSVLVPW
jgi:hypothetical protein